jgi:hypothetical protein
MQLRWQSIPAYGGGLSSCRTPFLGSATWSILLRPPTAPQREKRNGGNRELCGISRKFTDCNDCIAETDKSMSTSGSAISSFNRLNRYKVTFVFVFVVCRAWR